MGKMESPDADIPQKGDHLALKLSDGWAILADQNQWIIARARLRRDESYWQPMWFIGSNKRTLLRVLAEKGVQIDSEALATINTWPERFLDWRAS
tara:strand:+ start:2083 stop:2367 length:285 start_codon:yes stop_codon:yes gene_type:complete